MKTKYTLKNDEVVHLHRVTRIEVIDENGRSYVNWDVNNITEISLQDMERTLKVFISNRTKSVLR